MTPASFSRRRQSLGWSINQTAAMLAIDPRTVRRYEDGTRAISGTTQRCMDAFADGWRPIEGGQDGAPANCERITEMADLLYAALRGKGTALGRPSGDSSTMIDGDFDLIIVMGEFVRAAASGGLLCAPQWSVDKDTRHPLAQGRE